MFFWNGFYLLFCYLYTYIESLTTASATHKRARKRRRKPKFLLKIFSRWSGIQDGEHFLQQKKRAQNGLFLFYLRPSHAHSHSHSLFPFCSIHPLMAHTHSQCDNKKYASRIAHSVNKSDNFGLLLHAYIANKLIEMWKKMKILREREKNPSTHLSIQRFQRKFSLSLSFVGKIGEKRNSAKCIQIDHPTTHVMWGQILFISFNRMETTFRTLNFPFMVSVSCLVFTGKKSIFPTLSNQLEL